jgi:hypothetical protein
MIPFAGQVNVLAPFLLTKALLPIVAKVRLSEELLFLHEIARSLSTDGACNK